MSNSTDAEPSICEEDGKGLILPLVPDEHLWPMEARAVVYFVFLVWLFSGVGMASDVFMEAIERITSKRTRKFNSETGRWLTVLVWNPTVANLTLMALGSSAPEILLSVIELLGNEVFAGDLGPSTIVGSAAFNLFIIIAVCVMAIPDGEVRFIKETRVYMITAASSVLAYLWLVVILMGISPNVVEIWEAVTTFLFFPLLVGLAYLADRGYFGGGEDGPKMGRGSVISADMTAEELKELEEDIKARHGNGGNLSREALAEIMKMESAGPTSMAHYRRMARRKKQEGEKAALTTLNKPAGQIRPPTTDPAKIVPLDDDDDVPAEQNFCFFSFACARKACMEDVGKVELLVVREGLIGLSGSVGYRTKDGTAKSGEDYEPVEGRLNFGPGETEKNICVKIVDDDSFEEQEEFYVELSSAEVHGGSADQRGTLGEISKMAVCIIDNDVPGTLAFGYPDDSMNVIETPGEDLPFDIIVTRSDGATGQVSCKYKCEGASAIAGDDFEPVEGTLKFDNGEAQKTIKCCIKGRTRYQATQMFRVFLEEPGGGAKFDKKTDGGEECCILTVFIKADIVAQDPIQKLKSSLTLRWDKAKAGNANWASQFSDAIFNVYDDDDEDGDEEQERGMCEKIQAYVFHVLNLPFKLLCAFVPPPDYCGGWLCFCCSLGLIGGVTAFIADVAALFGCCLGVPDAVTAITFVALGTSLPDTFASKTAALQEDHADASVGNVTGSNSVNVFLGLGLPWTLGAIYWTLGTTEAWRTLYENDLEVPEVFRSGAFIVKAGDLSFSVIIFSAFALLCIAGLAVRRKMYGGELGGPKYAKIVTATSMVCLWLAYVALSSWKALDTMSKAA